MYEPRHPGILSWVVRWLTGAIVQSRTTGEWMNKVVCVFFRFCNNNRRGGGEGKRRTTGAKWELRSPRVSKKKGRTLRDLIFIHGDFFSLPSFIVCVAWRELSLLPLHSSITLYGLLRSIKSMYWLMRREKKINQQLIVPPIAKGQLMSSLMGRRKESVALCSNRAVSLSLSDFSSSYSPPPPLLGFCG